MFVTRMLLHGAKPINAYESDILQTINVIVIIRWRVGCRRRQPRSFPTGWAKQDTMQYVTGDIDCISFIEALMDLTFGITTVLVYVGSVHVNT